MFTWWINWLRVAVYARNFTCTTFPWQVFAIVMVRQGLRTRRVLELLLSINELLIVIMKGRSRAAKGTGTHTEHQASRRPPIRTHYTYTFLKTQVIKLFTLTFDARVQPYRECKPLSSYNTLPMYESVYITLVYRVSKLCHMAVRYVTVVSWCLVRRCDVSRAWLAVRRGTNRRSNNYILLKQP